MKDKPYSIVLWVLFSLFCFRVLSQLIQYFHHFPFLPSFSEWHSGTLSYSTLLCFQFAIIIVLSISCIRFSKGKIIPDKHKAKPYLFLGLSYAFVMLARYIIKMYLYPTERWFGGCLPILFHIVLASFIITIGAFHFNKSIKGDYSKGSARKIIWNLVYALIFTLIPVWILYQLAPTLFASKMGMRSPEYYVTDLKKVPIKMNDGVMLLADIYRPYRLASAPTILVRIPLDDNVKGRLLSNLVGRIWAERGYNVVIQGVRGRFGSKEKHIPFIHERADGIATLEWLNEQPWHNGKTGMWGGSYFGYTQWVLSDQNILGLNAIFTQISSSDTYRMFYPGNAFAYESALFWATRSYSDRDTPQDYEFLSQAYEQGPMIEADKRTVGKIPFYKDWVTHTSRDKYWQKVDGTERAKNLEVPALMMAGWYDPFLASQVQDFEDITNFANKDISNKCRLIIGPWAHAETVELPTGYKDQNYRLASLAPSLDWYDKHLKNITSTSTPKVKIFVMGINKWRNEDSFPLKRTKYTSYFLGTNNSSGNKGTTLSLDTTALYDSKMQTYSYNPEDPVPSIGGSVLGARSGPKNQNKLNDRKDILSYQTPVLKSDLEVTGKIKLILHVSTDALNTDFTAKLIDVFPDGGSYNISEGCLRRGYFGSRKVEKIEIELNPTSNVFLKGHRMRLDISSSNYPRFSLNYNTGGKNFNEKKGVIAQQHVYSGGTYNSHLMLPIIPLIK